MWQYNYTDELYHYGIKGQKWGIRRFQKKDGTRTNEGKERYKKENTIFTKRNVAIGAAVVATSLVAIGCMKYSSSLKKLTTNAAKEISDKTIHLDSLSNSDRILKKGTKFQRISSRSFEDYAESGKQIYASFDKKDNAKYLHDMPNKIKQWRDSGIIKDGSSEVYKHTMTMNKDVKVASPRKVAEIYKKVTGVDDVKQHNYANFMTKLTDRDNPTNKKFFDELKRAGYNAIIDDNDAGHYTKTPLILLDPGSDLSRDKVRKIGKLNKILNVLLY